jgi:DNA (cytosine-5)-methyltransferase 1
MEPDWWTSEWPGTPRIATGVKNRIDRLRCLGNSVVPMIPQLLGEAILRAKGLIE